MLSGPVDNIILLADCYKSSHYKVYPPGTTKLYAYFESRGGKYPYTVFFGLQYILKRWLCGPVLTKEMVAEAKQVIGQVFKRDDVFNEAGWNYVVEHHGGRLPLRIKAVPEGSVLPTRNVLFTVENTDPAVPWLTNFFETILVQAWYPMTVATASSVYRQLITHYLHLTHDTDEMAEYMLHDAGYRGVSSVESAALGGAAHMLSFKSSDTVAGTSLLRKFYGLAGVAGYSTPSSEHSTVISWGRNRELQSHRHMLDSYHQGDAGCVCDSYDIWKCLEEIWGGELKELVLERGQRGGCVYLRPDSGDPKAVVLKFYPKIGLRALSSLRNVEGRLDDQQATKSLEILGKAFGTESNKKGYKMLPSCVKVIQSDSIDLHSLWEILKHIEEHGWSTSSVFFGCGAALLQKMNRDTQKCAYKVSYAEVEGEGMEVFKQPITDSGKTSKKGRLTLERDETGTYSTVQHGKGDRAKDLLVPIFEDGTLLQEYTFEEVKQRADQGPQDFDIIKFLQESKN